MIERAISVIGLGYVGLPVAVAFGQKQQVIAFDINSRRIAALKRGSDYTLEVTNDTLQSANLVLTDDIADLKKADFHIVAVPTPIDRANKPDLTPLLKASETIGKALKKGDIVVYESTVYPGATEQDCVPILEKESKLICGRDFFVGYSPERINPGDKKHTFTQIKKVVSGQTKAICDIIADVYASVIEAGVYKASSIKVAEAAKVIENSQRDINIAFVNELTKIFHLMDIDIYEVLEAAETKWNFLRFKPGLVGGHCIGVDPYYLTYKAEQLGYHPEVILSGRRINDSMGKYVAELTVKEMIKHNLSIRNSKVAILGFTFKENCPDVRNTKVIDIINELKSYYIEPLVIDDQADKDDAKNAYDIDIQPIETLSLCRCVIVAVAHDQFKQSQIQTLINAKDVIIDVKNIVSNKKEKVVL
ncbi:MAG: nucleotide sugar dehydrogenase [Gammaproteobacteria bacterium]|nr:MAG: nucleotide sugar dehydrogenase [Gammaproteobacteria bacterium]UTW42480.1 nucleotide sugar dehydrogenase [bacterium SCSIO 12844]